MVSAAPIWEARFEHVRERATTLLLAAGIEPGTGAPMRGGVASERGSLAVSVTFVAQAAKSATLCTRPGLAGCLGLFSLEAALLATELGV